MSIANLRRWLMSKVLVLTVLASFVGSQTAFAAIQTVDIVVVIAAAGESTLTVNSNRLDMGTLGRTVENKGRFASPRPITLTFSTVASADLVAYTTNDRLRESGLRGVDVDTSEMMPLRVWTANFGNGVAGSGTPPNPANDTNWNDNVNGVWPVVRHVTGEGANASKVKLLGPITGAGDTNVDVHIGIDSAGVTPQQYEGRIVFELITM